MRLEGAADLPPELLVEELAARVDNLEPALLAIGEAVREREARIFATAGGGAWAPNDPDTIEAKGSSRILVDDGGLLRSLTNRGDRYHVERVTPDSVTVGTRNPVTNLLRNGARGTPRRDPLPESTPAERAGYAGILVDHLFEGLT